MTENDPLAYLAQVQREATHGFHPGLQVWVDDASSAAKVLRDFAATIPSGVTHV